MPQPEPHHGTLKVSGKPPAGPKLLQPTESIDTSETGQIT